MDGAQKFAVKAHMEELCDVINANLFLPHLRIKGLLDEPEYDLINGELTNMSQVYKSFGILESKEGGWEATVGFLHKHKYIQLVEKLSCSAAKHLGTQLGQTQIRLDWRQFIHDVVDFYLGDYRVVESFDVDGDSEAIESVWVDLQLEGSRESFSDYKEIFAQMKAKKSRLAIVRGQPGSGKTTLAKKIAYDWAKEEKNEIFDLILAVPLRDVQSKSDLLEMAVGVHLDNDDDIKQICAVLRREKLKILIILDGLDEIQIPLDSTLAKVFGSGLQKVNVRSAKPLQFDFDLIVTSRPFACQLIHANVMAVKYEIVGFTEERKLEYVDKRCKRPEGKAKAIEYFKQSSCVKEISTNPLLLTLICFLSDIGESIPSTLTQLYSTFVFRMLIRAAEKNAVKNVDPSNWQQSKLLEHLASLALFGVIKDQFQFSKAEMNMCHVTDEHFHLGMLHYRSNPVGLVLNCDFPHRSIQDFLAAFYSVNYWQDRTLIEATSWPNGVWEPRFDDLISRMKVGLLINRVSRTVSQFVHFYFGLISDRSDFAASFGAVMTEAIERYPFSPLDSFWYLMIDTANCSAEQQSTAGQICNDIISGIDDRQLCSKNDCRRENFSFAVWRGKDLMRREIDVNSEFERLTANFFTGCRLTRINNSDSFGFGSDSPHRLQYLSLRLEKETFLEDIGNLSNFAHLGYVSLRLDSSLQDWNEDIGYFVTQFKTINKLEIIEKYSPDRHFISVAPDAQHVDSPQSFSLKTIRMFVHDETVETVLETVKSNITVSSVRVLDAFTYVIIQANNDMTNFDLWNLMTVGI